MTTTTRRVRQSGLTLVELVISIVVIGVGLAGILVVINQNVFTSADPMAQHQAVAVAESYLAEILAKDFCEPGNTCQPGQPNPGANCTPCGAVEARALRNSVCDYNGHTDGSGPGLGPRDQDNNVLGLDDYAVQVTVTQDATASLGALAGNTCDVLRVDINVTGPAGVNFTLSGYRTNY